MARRFNILSTVKSSVDGDAEHLETFPKRVKLWKYIRTSSVLPELTKNLILGYLTRTKAISRDGRSMHWAGNARDRSAIVTSIAKAVYELLTENSQQLQECQLIRSYPQAKEAISDDDALVVQLSGFALHATIRFRKRTIQQQAKHSPEALQHFKTSFATTS